MNSAATKRVGRAESPIVRRFMPFLLFVVAVLSVIAWHGAGRLFIFNDGCQYLDAASGLESGRGLSIMVAHFDDQVAVGHFPIPFTHFAPGYPVLVAGLDAIGSSREFSAWTLSVLGFAISVWLVYALAIALGADLWAAVLMALLWAGNSGALALASTAATETLFMAALLGSLLAVVYDVRDEGRYPGRLMVLGLVAAFAYLVRYAGLFVVPAGLFYIGWRGWRTRAARGWAAVSAATCAVACAIVPVRNILIAGDWRGGLTAGGGANGHSIREIAVESFKAAVHDVLGSNVPFRPDVWLLMVAAAGVAVAWFAWRSWKSSAVAAPRHLVVALLWMGVFLGAYTGGIMLAVWRTIAFDLPRYLMPLYPAALAGAAALAVARTPRQRAAMIVLVAGITAVQWKSLRVPPLDFFAVTRAALDQPVSPGVSARDWLREHTRVGESIAGVNGQLLRCAVGEPVVATIDPAFSARSSDADSYRALMRRYRARYFVVMPGVQEHVAPEQHLVPWMGDLVKGVAPGWLTPAFRTENVAAFECHSCVGE